MGHGLPWVSLRSTHGYTWIIPFGETTMPRPCREIFYRNLRDLIAHLGRGAMPHGFPEGDCLCLAGG